MSSTAAPKRCWLLNIILIPYKIRINSCFYSNKEEKIFTLWILTHVKLITKKKIERNIKILSLIWYNVQKLATATRHFLFVLIHTFISTLLFRLSPWFPSLYINLGPDSSFNKSLFSCALQYLVLASGFPLIEHRQNLDYEYEKRETEDEMRWSVCDFEVLQYTT